MPKPKIYLETTLFNFYVDEDRGFAHETTILLFNEILEGKYSALTSRIVIDELNAAPGAKRDKMLNLILEYDIPVLETNDEVVRMADLYVRDDIIPARYRTDGLHIAIATVYDLDMVISMNFAHIVKRKTKIGIGSINTLNGYRALEIYSPMEIVENERD